MCTASDVQRYCEGIVIIGLDSRLRNTVADAELEIGSNCVISLTRLKNTMQHIKTDARRRTRCGRELLSETSLYRPPLERSNKVVKTLESYTIFLISLGIHKGHRRVIRCAYKLLMNII